MWTGKAIQLSASASSSLRYYQETHDFLGTTSFGAFGLSAGSQRTRVSINQSINYSPAYFYGLFPALTPSDIVTTATTLGPGTEYAVNTDPVLVYDSAVALRHGLTSRSSLSASGTFRYSNLSKVTGGQDLRDYSVGGHYLYELSRNSTLHVGYVYRDGQYPMQ